ncbi:MAG: hypothetical protein FWD57_13320 [Polyangiaceae bacterium]|nr:hypothetical protein [Polyangiaceae bacterium]
MADWIRRTTWSQEDEAMFFKKLRRAWSHNRPQYLRIQAYNLYQTMNPDLLRVAESLLCKMLTEYSDAKYIRTEMAPGYELLGRVCETLGEYDKSLLHYQNALNAESAFPYSLTDAYLAYAELVVRLQRVEMFSEIEQILLEREEQAFFPVQKYKRYIIMAIINKHRSNDAEADNYMMLAKQNADAVTSGFRYHKTLGLVAETHRWLENLLK